MSEKLLEIKDLHTFFYTDAGVVKAVNGVSFEVNKGQTIGIVGESGCGKSVMSLSIMRLIQEPGKIVDGQVFFNGQDLVKLSQSEMRKINGDRISMIFQEPMTSLNPVFTVGNQIAESLILHEKLTKKQAREKAIEMISTVGISRAEGIYDSYPHELSGGMRQRIMIAMALSCNPELLIADEPTTALDVTIQAQILDLLKEIKKKFGTSIMLITHDLGVVAEMADYVIVMYAGRIIEQGHVNDIYLNPMHPYTIGLLKSKPSITTVSDRLYTIPGQVPNLINLPEICYFSDRCKMCKDVCKQGFPKLIDMGNDHFVACTLFGEVTK
ncbi:oligopeptide/dipeptide ABC transporter, ATPase subunit [Ruminiclostridium papyrosolvens DSM 2782]|uniref:Oligopeptide/dipeptide ABC transporter, ATPase subunit n=1 Tax=Ruminiclostridium papyrosolvens DSM 2782 TaxID=588581 RepID=F1T9W9_9FIRM|nr:ABC transporter ATP-binding protein [Ruminiclostridium papyrosolvens]EGD48711.1 oligopeptide/dipeptide ABC transporter, ATPase subunit [Ruminiclostridium papyrosolvens DSM 2782]WES32533.1 ABC transporter ATP-binding protein [Ruminiclostridium papyrosolvens DSM 2782]